MAENTAGRAKRFALRAAMALVALNVWTGSPLLALWIGSRVQPAGAPQMGPVFVVIIALAVFSFALATLLARLGDALDRATGQVAAVHQHVPWLRSMRGERPQYPGDAVRVTGLERTLVVMVVLCAAAFEIWFFFYSTSPIDGRTGRSAVPLARASAASSALPAASTSASPPGRPIS
jgi:uncharacterized membrane protein YhaH (DUF805 family)